MTNDDDVIETDYVTGDVAPCDDFNRNIVRPTCLSLKREQFFPTLPMTPEHPRKDVMGYDDCDVMKWDIMTSSTLHSRNVSFYDDVFDVFSIGSQSTEKKSDLSKTLSDPSSDSSKIVKTKKSKRTKLCKNSRGENQCCSEWFRAYLRKLWVKAPPEPPQPPPETRPRQLSILERDFMSRPKSPRGVKGISRKRHSTTARFTYSAFFEEPVKELREEKGEGVIYSITVKKETLLRNFSTKSLSDADLEKGTTRHLKGATLEIMVGRLARVFVADNEDVNFLNVFLTTYRTFATPKEVFSKLSDEYMKLKAESSMKNEAVLRSIAKVFRAWLERYYQDDFYDAPDHQLLRKLLALAKTHDEGMNEEIDGLIKEPKISPQSSPRNRRKNGLINGSGFTNYVAAKLAVAGKMEKSNSDEPFSSPLASPTHSQNPSMDLTSEFSTLNVDPTKQLLGLSSRYLAAQLTVIAAKLFHRVQPHHCLAHVCSKNRPASVKATIDQFNRVVYCVMGTSLCPSLKLSQRTKILTKWVEVAQECRELKNFSSLRAIVSGLQTHAVHQLKRAWLGVPHSHMNLLKELADINMKDLIMKVGTAKVNTEDSSITRIRKDAALRRNQDMHLGIMHGTVPYLGSFLTDLTYLDTARPDFLENGYINFEKRRKEFELLAQLQLWQASCRSYQHLEPESSFMEWFQSITVLTDAQAYLLLEMIEPKPSHTASPSVTSPSRRSEIRSPTPSEAESINGHSNKNGHKTENGLSVKTQSFSGRITSPTGSQDRRVKIRLVRNRAKVSDGDDKDDVTRNGDMNSTCEYKTISISSNERTGAVIKKCLESFMMKVESNLKRFSLVQILHDSPKEIQIPDSANVFYAMNSADIEPTLVLLEEGAEIPNKVKRHQSTPAKTKKQRHRKNHSVSYVRSREGSPSRGSTKNLSSVASSPMKSIYRSIALSSVALVGGSYSPNHVARRSSDEESPPHPSVAASDGNVVLLTTRRASLDSSSDAEDAGSDPLRRHMREVRRSMTQAERLKNGEKPKQFSRCYSADFSSSAVVLPVKVIKPSKATKANSKSAPCSPQTARKVVTPSTSSATTPDEITATGRLTQWKRFNANTARSGTWSSRRALRKSKKPQSTSTFYVRRRETGSPSGDSPLTQDSENSRSRSKFYIDADSNKDGSSDRHTPSLERPTSLQRKVSKTLPLRFAPDFSGHDHDDDTEVGLDASQIGETPTRLTSFSTKPDASPNMFTTQESCTSLSSNLSEVAPSDDGSCISFVIGSEDVFDDPTSPGINIVHDPLADPKHSELNRAFQKLSIPPNPPQIKIQCPSPDSHFAPKDSGSNSPESCSESSDGDITPNETDDTTYL